MSQAERKHARNAREIRRVPILRLDTVHELSLEEFMRNTG